MTKKTDWNELLYHANDGDTILLAAGHLVYREMFDKECPHSELPNQFVLSDWLAIVLAKETYICPVLIRTMEAKTATWCIRWNGDVKEIAGRTTNRSNPLDLADIHRLWRRKWQALDAANVKDTDDEGRPGHPIMAFLRKWYDRSRGLGESHLYASNERFVQSYNPVAFIGQGVFRRKKEVSMPLKDALLPVARVDGEIMATQDPFSDTPLFESFYAPIPDARKAPFRKTLFDDPDCDQVVHTSNVILATLSNYSLTNPKNNAHLRTDIYKIAAFTFLFPHRVNIPFSDARRIIVGDKSNTQRNRRVNQAIDVLKGIQFLVTHKSVPITPPP